VLGCCSVSIMCSKDNNNIVAEVNEGKSCQTLYTVIRRINRWWAIILYSASKPKRGLKD
jgi:hypothetical protein